MVQRTFPWIFVFLAVTIIFPSLFLMMSPDQALEVYLGGLMNKGLVPYRDFHDINFPLNFLIHQFIAFFFGKSNLGVRFFDVLYVLFTLWVIHRFCRHFLDETIAWVSVYFYILGYFPFGYWHLGERDEFTIPFLLLSLLFFSKSLEGGSLRQAFLAGVLLAVPCWIKPIYIVGLFLILAWLAFEGSWGKGQGASKLTYSPTHLLSLLGGFFFLSLLVFAYLGMNGVLVDWFRNAIYYSLTYFAPDRMSATENFKLFYQGVHSFDTLLNLLTILGLVAIGLDEKRKKYIPLLLFLVTVNATMWIQGKGFCFFHQVPFVCAKAIIASIGVCFVLRGQGAWGKWQGKTAIPITTLFKGVLLSAILFSAASSIFGIGKKSEWAKTGVLSPATFDLMTGTISLDDYYRTFTSSSVDAQNKIGSYIHENTTEEDRIVIWGWLPITMLAADRIPSSPIFLSILYYIIEKDSELQREWKREFIQGLNDKRTKYVVLTDGDKALGKNFKGHENSSMRMFLADAELKSVLERNFMVDVQGQDFLIFKRSD